MIKLSTILNNFALLSLFHCYTMIVHPSFTNYDKQQQDHDEHSDDNQIYRSFFLLKQIQQKYYNDKNNQEKISGFETKLYLDYT